MISYTNINHINVPYFFDEFNISEEDLAWLIEMSEIGEEEKALDILIKEHIIPPGEKYRDAIQTYLRDSEAGLLKEVDKKKIIRDVALLGVGLGIIWLSVFKKYTKNVYIKSVFKQTGITNEDVRKSILDETIGIFDQTIKGIISQTSSFVINGIRTFQGEMIKENFKLLKLGVTGDALISEIISFKKVLLKKYPEVYNAMNKGNLLVTRKFDGEKEIIRHYKIDTYVDMVMRTTLLNVNRNANTIVAIINGDKVIEYILFDPREVKKDRDICQEILETKILGKSILALYDDIAGKLGIMTVFDAENSPDFAMGVGCRHSLRKLDNEYLQEIEKLLGVT